MVENGPAAALLVGYLSIQIYALPRVLPTAHFERNDVIIICQEQFYRSITHEIGGLTPFSVVSIPYFEY